jgi:hypothetical protein
MNEKEKLLLEKMHKAFGSPEVPKNLFISNEEKKQKEHIILDKMEASLTNIIQPKVIIENNFVQAATALSKNVTQPTYQVPEPQPKLSEPDFITKAVQALSIKNNSVIPISEPDISTNILRKEIDLIKKSIVDLHSFASRQSQMGGGGAGNVNELTFYTTTITVPSYTIGRKDYYVGVNYAGPVNITLPSNVKNGRTIVIKDESGNCNTNNITITSISIDNTTSVVLAINNGSLTFIYNNGWRII